MYFHRIEDHQPTPDSVWEAMAQMQRLIRTLPAGVCYNCEEHLSQPGGTICFQCITGTGSRWANRHPPCAVHVFKVRGETHAVEELRAHPFCTAYYLQGVISVQERSVQKRARDRQRIDVSPCYRQSGYTYCRVMHAPPTSPTVGAECTSSTSWCTP